MNQALSVTTRVLPFFAKYGFHPRMGFVPVATEQRPASRDANEFASNMETILSHLCSKWRR